MRVFNRDFISDSIFPVRGGEVPPILIVGKEGVEKQKDVAKLRTSLVDAQTAAESERSKKQSAERAFDRHCIDRAAAIKAALRSSGPNTYNNYDKSDFRTHAQSMAAAGDKETHRLTDSTVTRCSRSIARTPKPKLQPLAYQLPALKTQAETVSELLSTKVVSSAIQSLKDDPSLAGWVRQGLGLHQARHIDQCLFCEQALPTGRLSALEAHFNAEYERLLTTLDVEQGTHFNAAAQGRRSSRASESCGGLRRPATGVRGRRSALRDRSTQPTGSRLRWRACPGAQGSQGPSRSSNSN